MLEHPRFRAAYDFMMLRLAVGHVDPELCRWWAKFAVASEEERQELIEEGRRDARRANTRKMRPITLSASPLVSWGLPNRCRQAWALSIKMSLAKTRSRAGILALVRALRKIVPRNPRKRGLTPTARNPVLAVAVKGKN